LSEAVVNKKKELKEGKALAGFGLTEHSGIHIQSEQDNPITRQKFENHLDSDPHRRVACPLRSVKKMTRIQSIAAVHREPYKDILIQGDQRTEIDAPVLAFYEVELRSGDGQCHRFDAEIRNSPHGPQVDWYDALDNFLFSLPSREEANTLREELSMSIYKVHDRQSVGVAGVDETTSTEQVGAGDAEEAV
jgi:hypothetical protein